MKYDPNQGRITTGGVGGFLCPPTHPEHSYHVEIDLRRRPENRGSMSLSSAQTWESITPATRAMAREKLARWQQPAIESSEVQEWILQVLGYFAACYKGFDPDPWNAGKLRISRDLDPLLNADIHAGVHLIREYYPEFEPTSDHFAHAYWGSRPQAHFISGGAA